MIRKDKSAAMGSPVAVTGSFDVIHYGYMRFRGIAKKKNRTTGRRIKAVGRRDVVLACQVCSTAHVFYSPLACDYIANRYICQCGGRLAQASKSRSDIVESIILSGRHALASDTLFFDVPATRDVIQIGGGEKVDHSRLFRLSGADTKKKKTRPASNSSALPVPRKPQGMSRKEWYWTIYLTSATWSAIRTRVFRRDGYRCLTCGEKASSVHHKSYRKEVLAGLCDAELQSMCKACHDLCHPDKAI